MTAQPSTILFVVSQWRAPTQTFVWREVEAAVAAGHTVRILTLKPPGATVVGDPPVIHPGRAAVLYGLLGALVRRPARTVAILASVTRRSAPTTLAANLYAAAAGVSVHDRLAGVEWVHAHFAWFAGTAAYAAARDRGVPFSIMVHAFDIFDERFVDPLTTYKLRRAAFVGAESAIIAGEVTSRFGCAVEVVRMGVPAAYVVAEAGVRPSRHIVSVGSLLPKKGHDDLFRALARVPGPWRATVVGEGPERAALEALRHGLGLEGRIDLPGHVSPGAVRDLLDHAAVFCLASRVTATGDRDGVPNVLIEAMARGAPVVGTAVAGVPDLVSEGRGALVAPGRPDELAAAVAAILDDPSGAAAGAAKALTHVREHYTTEVNWMHLHDLMRPSGPSPAGAHPARGIAAVTDPARRVVARWARRFARSPAVRRLMAEHPPVQAFRPMGVFEHDGRAHDLLAGYRDHIVPRWPGVHEPIPADPSPSPADVAAARAAVAALDRLLATFGRRIAGAHVLEVGCHGGLHAFALAERGATVEAVDIPHYGVRAQTGGDPDADALSTQSTWLAGLREAGSRAFDPEAAPRVAFRDLDVADLDAVDTFDLVVSWETLEHLPRPGPALERIARALKRGGVTFHEYNPFFAADGGHSLCTLDFPYGHAVLDEAGFEAYVRRFRPDEADRAVDFHRRGLNRMTLADLGAHLDGAGLESLAILPWYERHDLAHVDGPTLSAVRSLHPTARLPDLLARRVWVLASRPGRAGDLSD